jgi:hypothetical protein
MKGKNKRFNKTTHTNADVWHKIIGYKNEERNKIPRKTRGYKTMPSL